MAYLDCAFSVRLSFTFGLKERSGFEMNLEAKSILKRLGTPKWAVDRKCYLTISQLSLSFLPVTERLKISLEIVRVVECFLGNSRYHFVTRVS
jgi:hypothetical protein